MQDIERVAKDVFDILRPGMLEGVYQDVMTTGLVQLGHHCEQEFIMPITMYGTQTKRFVKPDIVVDKDIVVELKACTSLTLTHRQQLERYLNISGLIQGVLINFGPNLSIEHCLKKDDKLVWDTKQGSMFM